MYRQKYAALRSFPATALLSFLRDFAIWHRCIMDSWHRPTESLRRGCMSCNRHV